MRVRIFWFVRPALPLTRLGWIRVPTLVLWGDSDGMFIPAYRRAMANALPNAHFTLVKDAGHLPHIEQPGATFEALDAYINSGAQLRC